MGTCRLRVQALSRPLRAEFSRNCSWHLGVKTNRLLRVPDVRVTYRRHSAFSVHRGDVLP